MPTPFSPLPRGSLFRYIHSHLGRDQTGATMIEYCIIIGVIAIVVVVAYGEIGQFPIGALETVGSHIGSS